MDTQTHSDLQARADALKPWRYDHEARGVIIRGAPEAAPIHGSLGRGRDMMVGLVRAVIADRNPAQLRALDLGCLEGHYTEVLAEAGLGEVVAVEWSNEHAERARFLLHDLKGYSNVIVRQGDVEDPTLLPSLGRFDIVLFHGLLYHMRNPVSVLERIRALAPQHGPLHLLLSTQFKFAFSEIADRVPLANVKVRKLQADASGRVQSKADESVYAPVALRLNPAALRSVLQATGFRSPAAYDTPTGARYGFQLHIVTATEDDPGLLGRLTSANAVPGVTFYDWNGRRLDGYDLDARIGRLAAGGNWLVRALAEKLGGSGARQTARSSIAD
jgi:SAM-dependent methyltransferase